MTPVWCARSRAAAFGAERWCDPCIARDALNRAGLAVVDATDTPNEDEANRAAERELPWCPRCGSSRRDIAALPIWDDEQLQWVKCAHGWHGSTGGSPGGSGTDDDGTRHAATPECVWSDVDPAWCNTHARYFRCPASTSGMCLELVESSKPCPAGECDRTPGGSGTVTQETSALHADPRFHAMRDKLAQALQDSYEETSADELRAELHGWRHRARQAEHLLRESELAPPFPGAHPGPVVDGQPTWGARLRDIPDEGYEIYQPQPGLVEDIWTPVAETEWVPSTGVLVRRVPQPATERVPWHEAVSGRRRLASGGVVYGAIWDDGYGLTVCDEAADPLEAVVDASIGNAWTVEVLVENEETET